MSYRRAQEAQSFSPYGILQTELKPETSNFLLACLSGSPAICINVLIDLSGAGITVWVFIIAMVCKTDTRQNCITGSEGSKIPDDKP